MRSIALAFLLLFPSSLSAQASDSIESKLGFRLTSPGPEWTLLDEDSVHEIQPRAVAGLVLEESLYNVVVVENLPADSLKKLARYWADNSGLENATVNLFEEFRFNDLSAIRWMVSGSSGEVEWSQHFVIFVYQKSLFRLVSWAESDAVEADGSSFLPFMNAFSLEEVDHSAESKSTPTLEASGIGWLVSDGIWKSPAFGIELRPSATWRVMYGDELRGMDLNVAAGMVDDDSKAKLTLKFDRLDREVRGQFATDLFKQAARAGRERREAILFELFGEEIELRVYDPSSGGDGASIGTRVLVGFEPFEEHCVTVQVEYPVARETSALENLRDAFAAMRTLERQERLEIDARARSEFEEVNQVGDGYSLRGGVYRDFRFGLSWKRPSLEWDIETGERAIERMQDAALYFSNPYWGISGTVVPVPVQTIQTESWHAKVQDELFPDSSFRGIGDVQSIQLGEVVAELSLIRPIMKLAPTEYRLITAVNDSWAFKIHLWGSPNSLSLASEEVDAALRGLAITSTPMPAKNASSGAMYDDRLGFQLLSPGEDWELSDDGKDAFWPAGDLAEWVRGEDECVGVIAICGLTDEEDTNLLGSLVRNGFPASFSEWLRKEPEVREMYFCGQSVRELSWNRLGRSATCWTISREQTLYIVYATDEDGEFDSERVCDLFSLLP